MNGNARTHVTFGTKLFNMEEERDYFINPCCFGDDCAQWLIDRLVSQGVEKLDERPTQEDWGWCFSITIGQRDFMVGVGLCDDEDPSTTWLVFIKSRLGWLRRKLYGWSDEDEILTVCKAMDRALKSTSEISDVRWHTEEDWMKGRGQNWRPDPAEV